MRPPAATLAVTFPSYGGPIDVEAPVAWFLDQDDVRFAQKAFGHRLRRRLPDHEWLQAVARTIDAQLDDGDDGDDWDGATDEAGVDEVEIARLRLAFLSPLGRVVISAPMEWFLHQGNVRMFLRSIRIDPDGPPMPEWDWLNTVAEWLDRAQAGAA